MSLRNPVRYPVKYYSWQDTQAPQLSNADGVIKTILKACLVTGYGSKAGAGWTSLFEDDYRIVLRRPLRTGNPPDIKIENGVFAVSGSNVTRHRIVSQDNPTGLDDANELSAFNLNSRSQFIGKEWYCVVTDFAFLLCYQIGNNWVNNYKNNALFIGSPQKLLAVSDEYHIANYCAKVSLNGTLDGFYTPSLFRYEGNYPSGFINLRTKEKYTEYLYWSFLSTEKAIDNDYFASPVIVQKLFKMPFFVDASGGSLANLDNGIISMNGRMFLRYVNAHGKPDYKQALYIPLDYWEL